MKAIITYIYSMQDFLFIKVGKKFSKIYFSEIMYTEAVKKYVRIITPKRVHLILASMCLVEKTLPPNQFCRIHRSYIVSLQYLTDFDSDLVYMKDKIFPIGKQYKDVLHDRVIILSSDTRTEFDENDNHPVEMLANISI